jgi:hypothetical protein
MMNFVDFDVCGLRRRRDFLFGSFSFVDMCGYVDKWALAGSLE